MLNRSRRHWEGFTLLETLLAISLMLLIIVSIVATTSLYAQYRNRGIEGARHSKIQLGTIADLQDDLHACYSLEEFPDTLSDELNVKKDNSNPIESNVATERVLSFEEANAKPIRFIGRPNAILLLRQGSNRRFEYIDSDPTSSQYQVLWLAPKTTTIRLPHAKEDIRIAEKEFKAPREGNPNEQGQKAAAFFRYSISSPDFQLSKTPRLDSRNSMENGWERNDEIKEVRFRFFDGTQWQNEWNSHLQNNRAPAAVEVRLSLVARPDQTQRLVFRMPE